MAFFIPCDDIDTKMYFSLSNLEKYVNSEFYLMYNRKIDKKYVDTYNDGILLCDVDKETLKIIQECVINDFDINVIAPYLKSDEINDKNYENNFFSYYESGCKCQCVCVTTDNNGRRVLDKLNNSLKKYIKTTNFKYNKFFELFGVTLKEFDLNKFLLSRDMEIKKIMCDAKINHCGIEYSSKKLFIDNWNMLMESEFLSYNTQQVYGD